MIKLTFHQEDGTSTTIDTPYDRSLMEVARDNDIPSLRAECGGCLACGTCHVVVDESWTDRLPAPDSVEQEMIGGLDDPRPNSRLSCQIALDASLDGLSVFVPQSASL